MENFQGRNRVIITNIKPQVDNGAYPAKRVLNEEVVIHADIFGDGHDVIKGSIFYRREKKNHGMRSS